MQVIAINNHVTFRLSWNFFSAFWATPSGAEGCACRSLLAVLRDLSRMLGIKLRFAMCKVSVLPTALLLWPPMSQKRLTLLMLGTLEGCITESFNLFLSLKTGPHLLHLSHRPAVMSK